MRLELHKLFVKQLKFGDKTGFSGGTLTVNKKELLDLIAEDVLPFDISGLKVYGLPYRHSIRRLYRAVCLLEAMPAVLVR